VNSITTGKSIDRMVSNSEVLGDIKSTLLGPDMESTRNQIQRFVSQFGLSSEDVKNLTVSALVMKLIAGADKENKGMLKGILDTVRQLGVGDVPAKELGLQTKPAKGSK